MLVTLKSLVVIFLKEQGLMTSRFILSRWGDPHAAERLKFKLIFKRLLPPRELNLIHSSVKEDNGELTFIDTLFYLPQGKFTSLFLCNSKDSLDMNFISCSHRVCVDVDNFMLPNYDDQAEYTQLSMWSEDTKCIVYRGASMQSKLFLNKIKRPLNLILCSKQDLK